MTEELKNFYALARRAKDMGNYENAAKYYEMALINDPNSWEANFYTIYFQAATCTIAGIQSAAISITNCIENVLRMVKYYVESEIGQIAAVIEISEACVAIATMLEDAASKHYNGIDIEIMSNYTQELIDRRVASMNICYTLGDAVDALFGTLDKTANIMSVKAWKKGIQIHRACIVYLSKSGKETHKGIAMDYARKIQKYEPSYVMPEIKTSGCYVATAVYGSYDCPQVWTLRRYRDDTLAETWYGRAFIKTYYAISPTLVKWFGDTEWFKKMWKGKLDRMVANLQSKGVESTPYDDREW